MIGFVNLFKTAGPSSAQAVARVRRIYSAYAGDRRLTAGHLGTLDPQAAGVLPLAIGKATRLIPLLTDQRKSYVFTVVLGRATETDDAHGATIATDNVPANWIERLEAALERFTGKVAQVPPAYSAAHHQGRRLYELARKGRHVEPKPRAVTIYGLRILGVEPPATARLRVACSEGTYVRSLCRDLGQAIGVPAHMGALVREASGPFVSSEAHTLEEIAQDPKGAIVAPEHILALPTIVLTLRESSDFRAGRIVALPQGAAARHVFVRDETRALVGIGEAQGALLAPRKVFL
ncbi:MAG: tRNA pseudouridine(55) synthase TruB [Candidatus Eremiobacteraeota bacterium]|nr:tRNA pseudouridine(55) synthase TruB [Candidatus Eremiobacteraeota bacterium]